MARAKISHYGGKIIKGRAGAKAEGYMTIRNLWHRRQDRAYAWHGVEHYRVRGLGDDKSYTWEEIMRAAYDGDDAA